MNTMTPRQSWCIFCETKLDMRGASLSMEQASKYISALKAGGEGAATAMRELEALPGVQRKGKATVKTSKDDWQALYNRAHEAGMKAGEAHSPTPMRIVQRDNPLDDNSKVVKQWIENDGECGFGWIVIKPANSSFALWLKKHDIGKARSQGGLYIWVHSFNQSYSRKMAYAEAFAQILGQAGIQAYPDGRLD